MEIAMAVVSVLSILYKLYEVWNTYATRPPPHLERAPSALRDRRPLHLRSEGRYNIAVCGDTKTGKSSLVNALIGLNDGEPGSAPVNVVECTARPKEYCPPDLARLSVWDLPGAGTPTHPAKSYYDDQYLIAYDCILLVCSDTIKATDHVILDAAVNAGQPIALVWTYTDKHVDNLQRINGCSAREALTFLKQKRLRIFMGKLTEEEQGLVQVFHISRWAFADEGGEDNVYKKLGLPESYVDEIKLLKWLEGVALKRQ